MMNTVQDKLLRRRLSDAYWRIDFRARQEVAMAGREAIRLLREEGLTPPDTWIDEAFKQEVAKWWESYASQN